MFYFEVCIIVHPSIRGVDKHLPDNFSYLCTLQVFQRSSKSPIEYEPVQHRLPAVGQPCRMRMEGSFYCSPARHISISYFLGRRSRKRFLYRAIPLWRNQCHILEFRQHSVQEMHMIPSNYKVLPTSFKKSYADYLSYFMYLLNINQQDTIINFKGYCSTFEILFLFSKNRVSPSIIHTLGPFG